MYWIKSSQIIHLIWFWKQNHCHWHHAKFSQIIENVGRLKIVWTRSLALENPCSGLRVDNLNWFLAMNHITLIIPLSHPHRKTTAHVIHKVACIVKRCHPVVFFGFSVTGHWPHGQTFIQLVFSSYPISHQQCVHQSMFENVNLNYYDKNTEVGVVFGNQCVDWRERTGMSLEDDPLPYRTYPSKSPS